MIKIFIFIYNIILKLKKFIFKKNDNKKFIFKKIDNKNFYYKAVINYFLSH